MVWIDGTDLAQWADRADSRGLLPAVMRRLVYATVDDLRHVEFRSGEGVQFPWMGRLRRSTNRNYTGPEGSVVLGAWHEHRDHGQSE